LPVFGGAADGQDGAGYIAMAMDGEALGAAVCAAFADNFVAPKAYLEEDAPQLANAVLSEAVLEYIAKNIEISYDWAGANASGAPEEDTFTAKVSLEGDETLEPSGVDTFPDALDAMLADLGGLIKQSIKIEPPAEFALDLELAFNPAGELSATMNGEDTHEAVWNTLGCAIVDSIKTSFVNPTPAPGTHTAYIGATTAMKID
jgi:hypothetical protein